MAVVLPLAVGGRFERDPEARIEEALRRIQLEQEDRRLDELIRSSRESEGLRSRDISERTKLGELQVAGQVGIAFDQREHEKERDRIEAEGRVGAAKAKAQADIELEGRRQTHDIKLKGTKTAADEAKEAEATKAAQALKAYQVKRPLLDELRKTLLLLQQKPGRNPVDEQMLSEGLKKIRVLAAELRTLANVADLKLTVEESSLLTQPLDPTPRETAAQVEEETRAKEKRGAVSAALKAGVEMLQKDYDSQLAVWGTLFDKTKPPEEQNEEAKTALIKANNIADKILKAQAEYNATTKGVYPLEDRASYAKRLAAQGKSREEIADIMTREGR